MTCIYEIHWNLFLQNLKFNLFGNNEEKQSKHKNELGFLLLQWDTTAKKQYFKRESHFCLSTESQEIIWKDILRWTHERENRSVMPDSLWLHGLYSPWNSPGQNTGWVVFPFSRGSSQPRNWTQVSHIAGRFFTSWATREAQEYWSG